MSDVIHIFQNASTLHKTLGILHAAIAAHDEITTFDQFEMLMKGFIPSTQIIQVVTETLDMIDQWNNPFLTMTAAGKVVKTAKSGTPLLDVALNRYLDAAASRRDTHPINMMHACQYALPFAQGSKHEARIYDELAYICQHAHSGCAAMLLEGLMDLQEKADEAGITTTPLADHMINLATVVMPHDPTTAMDAYSCALDDMKNGDPRKQPALEIFLTLCRSVAAQNTEAAGIGIDQILSHADETNPIFVAAQAFKAEMEQRLTEGNYDRVRPLTPAQYLANRTPKPA